jgi:drug/metabolite transporter (DMT)-like permease
MDCFWGKWVENPVIAVVTAAVLFGITTPVLKLLLFTMSPVFLVALLSLGAWSGMLCWLVVRQPFFSTPVFTSIHGKDWYWLAGTVATGGLIAPLLQFTCLNITPAAPAALLLNFEIVATVRIAYLVFHEPINRGTGIALVVIVLASVLLSWSGESAVDFSLGAMGILVSCFLWGMDNNFMGRISSFQPGLIVVIRGLCGGSIAWILVFFLHEPFPGWIPVICALITGFLSFGAGLLMLIKALRVMGAAQAGAVYATAPFIGCISSLILFSDPLNNQFWIALPLFIVGALIIIRKQWNSHRSF